MSDNVDPDEARLYKEQYEKARKMFEDGNPDKSIAEAKKDVNNLSLPPYYVIANCILVACGSEGWEEGNVWRLMAEHAYYQLLEKATEINDTNSLEVLKDLREELDKVAEFREQDTHDWLEEEGFMDVVAEADMDVTGGGHEEDYDEEDDDEEDDDEEDDVFEDVAAVAEAEEAILSLPMRPAPAITELNVSPPPVPGISAPNMSITSVLGLPAARTIRK